MLGVDDDDSAPGDEDYQRAHERFGRMRAEEGLPLHVLLRTHLMARRILWSALREVALPGEQDALLELRMKLEQFAATVDAEVAALDARWRAGDKDLGALEAVYRKYSYITRWRQQLEEREIALLTGE